MARIGREYLKQDFFFLICFCKKKNKEYFYLWAFIKRNWNILNVPISRRRARRQSRFKWWEVKRFAFFLTHFFPLYTYRHRHTHTHIQLSKMKRLYRQCATTNKWLKSDLFWVEYRRTMLMAAVWSYNNIQFYLTFFACCILWFSRKIISN